MQQRVSPWWTSKSETNTDIHRTCQISSWKEASEVSEICAQCLRNKTCVRNPHQTIFLDTCVNILRSNADPTTSSSPTRTVLFHAFLLKNPRAIVGWNTQTHTHTQKQCVRPIYLQCLLLLKDIPVSARDAWGFLFTVTYQTIWARKDEARPLGTWHMAVISLQSETLRVTTSLSAILFFLRDSQDSGPRSFKGRVAQNWQKPTMELHAVYVW